MIRFCFCWLLGSRSYAWTSAWIIVAFFFDDVMTFTCIIWLKETSSSCMLCLYVKIITALSFKATSSNLKGKRICYALPFSFKYKSLINLSKNQYSGCWVDNCNPEHITCSPHPSNQYIMWHASNSSRGMHMHACMTRIVDWTVRYFCSSYLLLG